MKFRYGFLMGLISGWMLEQTWGKFSGRPQSMELLVAAKDEARYWQAKALEWEQRQAELPNPDQFIELQRQLDTANQLIEQLQAQLAAHRAANPDSLTRIKGIGRAFAERLNEAGIYRFDELIALTPEEILEIVRAEPWQKVEPTKWIEQAQTFVNQLKS